MSPPTVTSIDRFLCRARRSPRAALLAAALLLAAPARAASPAAGPAAASLAPGFELHLPDALALARRGNWELRSAQADVAIARANLRTARQHPNPSLSVITSRIHNDGLGDATPLGNDLWSRGYDTVTQLGQTLELAGKRGLRRRAAAAAADAARARLADNRRTLEAEVLRAYVAAALASADVRIARESASYLRDEARIAEVRWKAGDISRSDLDQIEIAAARLDLDAHGAENAALGQRVALETLLGVSAPGGDIVIADSLEALVDSTGVAAQRPQGGVRPDLAAAQAEQHRADAAWRLEKAQRIPDPTLVLQFEHQPPDRPNTLGIGLALPLPLWNRNTGSIEAARSARDQADIEAERAAAAIAADIASGRAALEEASSRWRRYRDELRPRSDSIRRSVSLAYEKGGASLLDLLEAQRNDNDVRHATIQAASDSAIAATQLHAATTTIIPEVTRP